MQETLRSLQLFLMQYQIMDEDANLLVDPQELFDQHAKLEMDLELLIEKFQNECDDNLPGKEREQLKAILETLVSQDAQD